MCKGLGLGGVDIVHGVVSLSAHIDGPGSSCLLAKLPPACGRGRRCSIRGQQLHVLLATQLHQVPITVFVV